MSIFKKFTATTGIIAVAYIAWVYWLFTQSAYYMSYAQYAYALTFTALFACFFFAKIIANKSYGLKIVLILLPYLLWIFWMVNQNIDQTMPSLFAPLLIMGIFAFVISVFVMVRDFTQVDTELLQTGEKASAKILAIEDSNITIANTRFAVILTLEVQSTSRGVFTTKVQTLVSRVQIPRPGDMVNVVFDPTNPDRITVV